LFVLKLSVLIAEERGCRRAWAQEARLVGHQRAAADPKPGRPKQRTDRKPLYDVPLGAEREDRVPLVAAGTDSGKKLSLLTAERKQPRESRLVIVAGLGKTHPEPEPEGAVGHRGPGAGDLVDERFEPGVSGVGDPIDSIIHRYVRCLIDAAGRPCHAPGDGDAESQIARVGERRSDYYAEVPRHGVNLGARDRGVQRLGVKPRHDVTGRAGVERGLLRDDQAGRVIEVRRCIASPSDVRPALERLILADQHVVVVWEDQRLGERNGKLLSRGNAGCPQQQCSEPKAVRHVDLASSNVQNEITQQKLRGHYYTPLLAPKLSFR